MRINFPPFVFILLTAFLLTTSLTLPSQEASAPKKQSIFDIISLGDEVKAELELDMDLLEAKKNTEDYLPAVFTFEDSNGNEQTWNIEVRNRGRFRRRICHFPPLKLKFDKDALKEKDLKKHNELKLVTHCLDNEEGKDNILREALIYKLYEAVSPYHYRTQMIRIKYRDSKSNRSMTRFGILLEDENELDSRLDSRVCDDCYSLPKDTFDLDNLNRLALFQYMIGNPDWSITMVRNLKLLESKENGKFFAVPYDFDFTGLVNASYAIPDPTLGIGSVRERAFLGFAETEAEIASTVLYFESKKETLLEIVRNYKLLPRKSRNEIIDYLESFYAEIESGQINFVAGRH